MAEKIIQGILKKQQNKEPLLQLMSESAEKETALGTMSRYASPESFLTNGSKDIIERYGIDTKKSLYTFCGP